ncbi:TonB-dependent receptor [Croceibacterium ferulae]|uniref:TonB-dependent receptor n=1 Tax=Croceibacterium ferulae TaxID=1854641 RepID=UPI000EB0B893|nr:TonB-dependent receptor [Croceibacterium ferulae]
MLFRVASLRLSAFLLGTSILAAAQPGAAQAAAGTRSFSVPAGPASASIPQFARQAGLQILVQGDAARDARTRALSGAIEPRQALARLLAGSGLKVASWRGNIVTLVPELAGGEGQDTRNVGSEEIIVTGIAAPFRSKGNSTTIVESVVYDDVETLAADGSIAGLLTQLPGISTVEDGEYPRYVTIRGISPDLNHTTIDGLTLATVGESGAGTRRVNLQLMPSDVSKRVDVFKTFTAEQDAGAIGGAINIVTRSAFDRRDQALFVDAYGMYRTRGVQQTGSNAVGDPGDHWGGGVKANYATTFGASDQFGVIVSGRYDSTPRNFAQNWQNTKRFLDQDNEIIARPEEELGWNGRVAPAHFGYGTYADVSETYGGSAKLEYRSPDDAVQASVMGYNYVRIQDQSTNINHIDFVPLAEELTEEGGRGEITQLVENYRHNQYRRENRGILSSASHTSGATRVTARAGLTEETFRDWEPYVSILTNPTGYFLNFSTPDDEIPILTGIEDPSVIMNAPYRMNAQRDVYSNAQQEVFDARLDVAHNVERGSQGFGVVAGVEYRRLDMSKDVERTDHSVTGTINEWIYDSGYRPPTSPHSFAWLDYNRFRQEKWDDFPVNESASFDNSHTSDYRYLEELATAYASVHLNLPATTIVGGLRYDHIDFTGTTPVISQGSATGEFSRNDGGYDYLLPSLNIVHRLGDTNVRLSWSETLGRPTPGNIAQAENINCSDTGDVACTITRGNPDLKPRRSRNLDATVEHYYAGANGMLLLGYFHKRIKDDIFTLREEAVIDGELYAIRQPLNASDSEMQGIEAAWVHRGLPVGLSDHQVDLSANATRMWGEMNYVTDAGNRAVDRLINQPDWILNGSVTYRIPQLGAGLRVNANYRDAFLSSVGANPWQDEGAGALTTVNLALWHDVTDNLLFKYEWNNVFDNQPHFRLGENLDWVRQQNEYGSSLFFHAIMKL